jgi:hypothetical protein
LKNHFAVSKLAIFEAFNVPFADSNILGWGNLSTDVEAPAAVGEAWDQCRIFSVQTTGITTWKFINLNIFTRCCPVCLISQHLSSTNVFIRQNSSNKLSLFVTLECFIKLRCCKLQAVSQFHALLGQGIIFS